MSFPVYGDIDQISPAAHQTTDVPLSLSDVNFVFSKLNDDSGTGPNNIHPMPIHSCPSLVEPFYIFLISQCLKVLSLLHGRTPLLCLHIIRAHVIFPWIIDPLAWHLHAVKTCNKWPVNISISVLILIIYYHRVNLDLGRGILLITYNTNLIMLCSGCCSL